jgi:tRNA(Ile)-lysidine synthase
MMSVAENHLSKKMDTLSKTLIFNSIETFSCNNKLFSEGQTILLGLSGGPDSVFLVYFFIALQKKYNLKLVAAHIDHGWRTESQKDALFCKKLCAQFTIPFYEKHVRDITSTKTASGSAESDARNARRTFFNEVAHQITADAIALAHHQDDRIETFFIRLVRGSGLSGLTSIKARSGIYIRPLLETGKSEILAYLHEHGIPYCIDSTNQDTDFLRNNIRHTLIPAYTKLDTRAGENLVRTIEKLQQSDNFIEKIAHQYYQILVEGSWLDIEKFLALDPILQHRVLLLWIIDDGVQFTPTEKFFAEITRFFEQTESKTHWITQNWGIQKVKRKAHIVHQKFDH